MQSNNQERAKLSCSTEDFLDFLESTDSEQERILQCAIRFGESYEVIRPIFDQQFREDLLLSPEFQLERYEFTAISFAPTSYGFDRPTGIGINYDNNGLGYRQVITLHGRLLTFDERKFQYFYNGKIDIPGVNIQAEYQNRQVPGFGGTYRMQPGPPIYNVMIQFYLDQASSAVIEYFQAWRQTQQMKYAWDEK